MRQERNPLTGAIPLGEAEAQKLLLEVLERARRLAPAGLVVFDLDSTLLDNRPRQAQIMRDYGKEAGVEALAGTLPEHWEGWDSQVAMRNAGLSPEAIAEHHQPFRDHWRRHFFTSEYCRLDRPLPGAPDYVQAVAATGCTLCYVTGRHEPMREGTLHSFEIADFPIPDGDRVHLFMKPSLGESDDAFKERTFAELRRLGELVAAFDNEPTHINAYGQAFPDAQSVHLATDHSPRRVKIAGGIPSICDFSPFLAD